jgi:LysM repeat protein
VLGFATIGASVLAAVTLSACGGDDPATAQTTIAIRPTAYVTLPVVTTVRPSSTVAGQAPADRVATGEGEVYRVRTGDALPLIADRYGITVEELVEFNDWEDGAGHMIHPGQEVLIPSFADEPEDEEAQITDERPDDGLGTMPDPGGGPMCPDGTERDTYEIVAGDFISRVADKNDLSIEELEAANADNPAWQVFAPGQKLWLPCEGEDLTTPASSAG